MEVLEHFYQKILIPIKIGSFDISITNLTVSMFAGVGLFLLLFFLLAVKPRIVPSKRQTIIEFLINFIKRNIVYNMIGKKEGDKWLPLISAVFIFVLSNNMIGLIPGDLYPNLQSNCPTDYCHHNIFYSAHYESCKKWH